MSKIAKAFRNGKAFIPFITCGDPTLEVSEELVCAMAEAGADVIELGIPFSDPTAEGPVIQESTFRVLSAGVTTDRIFETVRRIRARTDVPICFMTYANVVFSYGTERFIATAAELGVDGLILPDVPFEEQGEFEPVCHKYGLDFISFIAPTSKDRTDKIASAAKGFLYCISSLGVTGERADIRTDVGEMVARCKRANPSVPCAVGFGISRPEQAAAMAAVSDGVIVGSTIVKLCAKYGTDCVPYVAAYVKEMKDALRDVK